MATSGHSGSMHSLDLGGGGHGGSGGGGGAGGTGGGDSSEGGREMASPTIIREWMRETPSLEVDRQLARNVNLFLGLNQRSNLQAQFDQFNIKMQTLSSLESFISVLFLCSVPILVTYSRRFETCHSVLEYFTVAFLCALTAGLNILCWCVYANAKRAINMNGGELPEETKHRIQWAQILVLLLWLTKDIYRMLARVIAGPCPENNTLEELSADESWKCNATAEYGMLPFSSTVSLMLLPLFFSVCVRGSHYAVSIALWMMSMSTMVMAAIYTSAYGFISSLCLYGGCSIVVIMEMRRINLFRFFTHLHLEEISDTKAKAADTANAQELRSMIANVAHDLKTPLTSFLTGVEFIGEVIQDLHAQVDLITSTQAAEAAVLARVNECFASINNCAHDMRTTNAFMLMTINRCIDYTKVTKGVKLMPRLETIDLMEVLKMPFKCMKDVQQRVGLTLAPLPINVCSHVITDGQWLQENVLCLLSNAIKYSSQGTVLVRVSRVNASVWSAPPTVSSAAGLRGISDDALTARVPYVSLQSHLGRSMSVSLRVNPSPRVYCTAPDRGSIDLTSPTQPPSETEMLRVEVEDHGIGLSDEAMANLFNPFKQAQRLAGGTGLGLFSLAKRIESLGGRCGVERRRDDKEGSIFWFEIPYRPDVQTAGLGDWVSPVPSPVASPVVSALSSPRGPHPSPSRSVASPRQPASSAHPQPRDVADLGTSLPNPLNILVVDDSPSILKMTTMSLRRHKHNVLTATNGAEAVKIVTERMRTQSCGFDLVLMDLQMPVMDGLEATRRLRTMEASMAWPHVIVMGVSANSDSETVDEAQAAGVDAFIPKPFTLDSFYRVYHSVCAN